MSNNTNNTNTTKYTLLVPFDDKDIVKKLTFPASHVNFNSKKMQYLLRYLF